MLSEGERTQSTIESFNEAVNAHDLDAIAALLSDDTLFENTVPPPDGERFTGKTAVLGFWAQFFAQSPQAHFETEDLFVSGEQAAVRWRYTWAGAGGAGHIRGVDVFLVRDGLIAEKRSYVKG